jgi:hypothetical protein
MSEMSQFSVQWNDLTQVPASLAEIELEIRGLSPLLNSSDAARSSAPIVASAMGELSASLVSFIEQNASELRADAERFGQVIRNYQNADRSVADASQQLCRSTDSSSPAWPQTSAR